MPAKIALDCPGRGDISSAAGKKGEEIMMVRVIAFAAATVLAAFGAEVAASGGDGDLASDVLACSAEQGDAAQLACYNRIAARLKAAEMPASRETTTAPPAPALAQTPSAPTSQPVTEPSPVASAITPAPSAAAPAQSAPAFQQDFAADSVPFKDDASQKPDRMTAHVVAFSYNFYHHFEVALDNGQIWRQADNDTATAKLAKDQSVTVTRGFLDSFHLAIDGEYGNFNVTRIK
jgi:hypothetical protein